MNDKMKPKSFAFIYQCATKAIKYNLIKLHNDNFKCSSRNTPKVDRAYHKPISARYKNQLTSIQMQQWITMN